MSSIAENFTLVRQQIHSAAADAQRSEASVQLLAVSKTRHADELRQAWQTGQRAFGENYLQESLDKIEVLKDLDIEWHFIGPIQSNKTRPIAENFDWVHSVDRFKIAQRLSDQRSPAQPPLNICLQINISREDSKAGCLPEEAEELLNQTLQLPNIRVRGLMAIPKSADTEAEQRKPLTEMNQLLSNLNKSLTDTQQLDTLSMGMSGDMAIAIQEGATIVRVGTALFGPRNYKQ